MNFCICFRCPPCEIEGEFNLTDCDKVVTVESAGQIPCPLCGGQLEILDVRRR